jgi:beta-lactamase superfamily II metal-dependent hydrolase
MWLQIFDVEHGACALLTADNGARLMIDCGHNATTGWRPGEHLRTQGIRSIEGLAITNYDEDHASGAPDLFDKIQVQWLYRNHSVSPVTIKLLKTEDGMGLGIERLFHEIATRFTGNAASSPEPPFPNIERRYFWHNYPAFDDENNLSLVLFLKCCGVGVMFPGDLERAGFLELLKREAFRSALRETRVYVASHHGRENGCCEETLPYLTSVNYVVISDKGYQYDTQTTTPFYSRIAKGGPFRNQTRQVLTTRNDGTIAFSFAPSNWGPR